jgi:hypothetical protein
MRWVPGVAELSVYQLLPPSLTLPSEGEGTGECPIVT